MSEILCSRYKCTYGVVCVLVCLFSFLSITAKAAVKDNARKYDLHTITWYDADSMLQNRLQHCLTGIDSVRLLREFTTLVVRSTWDDQYYEKSRSDSKSSLEVLYRNYTADTAVGICSDYSDFFAKLLDRFGIQAYIINAGLANSKLSGHSQVAVRFIYNGREVIQVHDAMHNCEYIDADNHPLDIRVQLQYILSNNYKHNVKLLEGTAPRTILIRRFDWLLAKLFYPYPKDLLGRLRSTNERFSQLAFIKGSLKLMTWGNRNDTRIFLARELDYMLPREAKYLQLLFTAAIYNISGIGNNTQLASQLLHELNTLKGVQ